MYGSLTETAFTVRLYINIDNVSVCNLARRLYYRDFYYTNCNRGKNENAIKKLICRAKIYCIMKIWFLIVSNTAFNFINLYRCV